MLITEATSVEQRSGFNRVKPRRGGLHFRFGGVQDVQGPNYTARQGSFLVSHHGSEVGRPVLPEKREFTTNETTEAAIEPGLFRDLYVALGDPLDAGAWSVRVQYKPLVRFIWLGGIFHDVGRPAGGQRPSLPP